MDAKTSRGDEHAPIDETIVALYGALVLLTERVAVLERVVGIDAPVDSPPILN